jgi:hypothetical protein
VKLLGIDIDYQLNFYAHISTICRKASQQQNILKHFTGSWEPLVVLIPHKNYYSLHIQNGVLFPALFLIFLNIYQYRNARPKGKSNFYAHISTICRKASQQQNILKHLGSYLNRLNKLTIFHTFILSNFNFCPLAWHFCTDKYSKI